MLSSFHLAIVLVFGMITLAAVLTARYRAMGRGAPSLPDPEADRLKEEVQMLRDRISVLERITVEKENSLERQIEALRDR